MTRASMIIVRLSLAYLVVGTTIGSLLLGLKGWPVVNDLLVLRPLHFEFLLFGWMVQLAIGVASWILPKIASRSGTTALTASVVLLNAGIWSAALGDTVDLAVLLFTGRALQMAAIGTFAWYIWPRVRSFR